MKKIIQTISAIIVFTCISADVFSQWVQRLNLPGSVRTFATAFSIGDTAYIVGGYDGNGILFDDVWAYEATGNTWTQKGNFPGGLRSAATAFTIGNKAYMGTGADGVSYTEDFWEYDPSSDTWLQKSTFPGGTREEAVGFSIGNVGYMGTGQVFVLTPNNAFTITFSDFYEYNPSTDTWTQKADVPGPTRAYAVGASIGNKGYIGLGGNDDQSDSFDDFYEYDPVTDSWTAKASMNVAGRADAGLLATSTNLYVIGGINFPNFNGFPTVYQYDPATDLWSTAPSFAGSIIIAPVVVNLNGLGYVGTGYTGSLNPRKDWWEFTPSTSTSVNDLAKENLKCFLNTADNILTLTCDENIFRSQTKIEIVDELGKEVLSQTITSPLSNEIKIDVTQLAKGLYVLHLQNTETQNRSLKFIR